MLSKNQRHTKYMEDTEKKIRAVKAAENNHFRKVIKSLRRSVDLLESDGITLQIKRSMGGSHHV